jgi:succinate-semialdehyde dehydrogenase / glutarate-semialdehyde dehydrogenase
LITTVNPATGQPIAKYETTDVETVLAAAASARAAWAARDDRATVLLRMATVLRRRKDELATLVTTEMGKPLAEAVAEVEKCAVACEFYAVRGPSMLADDHVTPNAWVTYEPIGTVLAVMPWNFPLWQVIRFAAPALLAGNATVLKHSRNTSGCALALADVFAEAGLPTGLFGVVLLSEQDTPDAVAGMIADPRIDAVTVTGSERAGSAIAAHAGRAIKKSVLELGGSDPFIVMADADLPAAVAAAVRARFANAGQSCISAKRFIIAQPVYDAFLTAFTEAVEALVVGDPTDPATRIGPLAREDLVVRLADQVVRSGATILAGGHRLDREGFFYAPTVLTDVTRDMPVWTEETFGPVAAVVPADDADHAVLLANDTSGGLGASVWTRDVSAGQALGWRLRSGSVFVNAVVASDPRLPFGGIGRSGYGRELATAGIREFVNVRTWWTEEGK